MQDVYIDTEVLTQPFQFAMVASRAAAVLKGIQEGRQLDNRAKQALSNAAKLVDRAVKGGAVLRDKNMAEYSAEAMSAYHLVENNVPGANTPRAVVSYLQQVADALRKLEKSPALKTKISKKDLQELFIELANRSLNESGMPFEEVIQNG